MNYLRFLFSCLLTFPLLFAGKATAQDIQFSQFYAVTPYINPAYAGSQHAVRGMVHSRLQWPGLDATYFTMYAGGDGFLHKYNSGVGFYLLRDYQGGPTITSTELQGQYSYEIPLSSKIVIRAGLQAGFQFRNVNYANLTFPHDYTGDAQPANLYGATSKVFADIGSGALLYSDNLWAGISFHHMNTPNQSLYDSVGQLPMQTQFSGGYKIHLVHGKHMAYLHDAPEISVSPTVNYKFQGKSDQLDIGVYGIYDQFLVGLWYRGIPVKHYDKGVSNREAIVLLGGWRYNDFTFGLSYDFTVSKLTKAGTGGSYEINITYSRHRHNKHHKLMKRLPCPDLYKH